MSEEPRYHLRRGKTPGLVDDVAGEARSSGETQPPPMSRTMTASEPVLPRTTTLSQPAIPRTVTPTTPQHPRTVTPTTPRPRTLTPTAPFPRTATLGIPPAMPSGTRTEMLSPPPRTTTPRPQPPRTVTAPIPALAHGSSPDWRRPVGIDLDDLADVPSAEREAVPVIERTPTTFGPNQLVVEYHGDRVAIVIPGVVRLVGTVEDGRLLSELLARRPR